MLTTYEFDGMQTYLVKGEGITLGKIVYNSYNNSFEVFDVGGFKLTKKTKWADAYRMFNDGHVAEKDETNC